MKGSFECVWSNDESLCRGSVHRISCTERGSGGFATVYKVDGIDGLPGDHDYAIKWYDQGTERDTVEREYNTLCLLGGARGYAPRAYALGHAWRALARHWAIIMELMGGSTLEEAYDSLCEDNEVTLDARRALAALGQVARACEACRGACEDRGVNRDLQPKNVMVEVDPERREVTHAAIVDWGQAPESRKSITPSAYAKLATPPFAAPEMFGGEHRDSSRNVATVDVWSLGALGFWLRTREKPHELELEDIHKQEKRGGREYTKDGNERRAAAKVRGIDLGSWLEACGIRTSPLDEKLSDLIAECTRFDPDERPKNPGEVANRIDGILEKFIKNSDNLPKKSQISYVPWNTPSNKSDHSKLSGMVLDDDRIISSVDITSLVGESQSNAWDDTPKSVIGESVAVDTSAQSTGLEPNSSTIYTETDGPDSYASGGHNDPCDPIGGTWHKLRRKTSRQRRSARRERLAARAERERLARKTMQYQHSYHQDSSTAFDKVESNPKKNNSIHLEKNKQHKNQKKDIVQNNKEKVSSTTTLKDQIISFAILTFLISFHVLFGGLFLVTISIIFLLILHVFNIIQFPFNNNFIGLMMQTAESSVVCFCIIISATCKQESFFSDIASFFADIIKVAGIELDHLLGKLQILFLAELCTSVGYLSSWAIYYGPFSSYFNIIFIVVCINTLLITLIFIITRKLSENKLYIIIFACTALFYIVSALVLYPSVRPPLT